MGGRELCASPQKKSPAQSPAQEAGAPVAPAAAGLPEAGAQKAGAETTAKKADEPKAEKPKEILLLMESSAPVRRLLVEQLRNRGFEVVEAVSTMDALHQFTVKIPAACVFACMLNSMVGTESVVPLVRRLTQQKKTQQLPLV